jgi:hypothetical protein
LPSRYYTHSHRDLRNCSLGRATLSSGGRELALCEVRLKRGGDRPKLSDSLGEAVRWLTAFLFWGPRMTNSENAAAEGRWLGECSSFHGL